MGRLFREFLRDEGGQDFAEYALILGAVALVAALVLANFRSEIKATFDYAVSQLRGARGG